MPGGPSWLDAQLPPQLAPWLTETFGVPACSASDLGYRDAGDDEIFQAARAAGAVVVSKGSDFLDRVTRLGPPPHLLYVTCRNTSTRALWEVFIRVFPEAHRLLEQGEAVVEIGDRQG
ncbi:DUF5615 family PIN-like protein [Deinococcus budaensis]|uniref:Putative nuclease of putative toxin-antitoxin system n=1 Tax=Deinococcus budaensis TaxID=1665626 RepID=A0A7W8LR58_9DEIO|nr:DUF5615 family PIN-like protein [Deinococcus budaensis]MBB5235563.1 putative nuclease of putative toxin-antitoxin system [Deinococcus budaensis]